MKKFSEELTHRDYLGALMNLGISRTKTGDIIVQDKQAYLIVSESIADYICENLTRIRHTSVMCRQIDWQEFDYKPQVKEVMGSIASVRLDAVIGLAFSQSRSKLTGYISEEKVQVPPPKRRKAVNFLIAACAFFGNVLFYGKCKFPIE